MVTMPQTTESRGVDLAWSVAHTALDVVPGDGRRPLPKALLAFLVAFLAGVAVAAVALVAFMLGQREPERINAPPTQPTSTAAFPTPAATPPSHEALVPVIASAAVPSSQFDRVRDQWLLDNLRSLGYLIINPPLVIHNAHESCRLFEQGESPEQVNQQMSAVTGLNIDDTLQLTSSAMLAYYPNCA
jgi:hypothetical protein